MRDTGRPGRLRFTSKGQAATSGQVGPKSGKLRQDSKKPRPSERLRRDGEPPPGNEKTDTPPGGEAAGADSHFGSTNKKTAQDGKRMEKSKLRMEKNGEKLNTAREKLENQKPQNKPGPVKKVSRAARYQSWRYVHGKFIKWSMKMQARKPPTKQSSPGNILSGAVHALSSTVSAPGLPGRFASGKTDISAQEPITPTASLCRKIRG